MPMQDGTNATVVQRTTPVPEPPPEPGSGAATPVSTRKFTYSTPAESMRAEEMLRTRVFFKVVLGLIFAVGAVLPVMGGDRLYKLVFAASLGVAAIASGIFLWIIRDE